MANAYIFCRDVCRRERDGHETGSPGSRSQKAIAFPAHGLLRYRPVQVSPKGHLSCLSYPNVRLHVLHSFVGNKSELLSVLGTVVSPGTLLSVSSRWGGRAVGLGLIKVRSTRSLQVGSSSNLRHHFLMLTGKQERCSEKQNHVIQQLQTLVHYFIKYNFMLDFCSY